MADSDREGFFQRVYNMVKHRARYVGFALHVNPEPGAIPCHRIVFADGRLADGFAFGGPDVQRHLLEEEGVSFLPDGRVDLKECRWPAGTE